MRASTVAARLATAALVAWFGMPFVPLVVWAFADRWTWPSTLPQQWGLRGWASIGQDAMLPALARSAVLGALVAAVATPLGALAGRALGWRLAAHPGPPTLLLLAPVALPPFAIAMGVDSVLLRARIPGTLALVLVLAVFALPYTTAVFRSAYTGLDPELEHQARMLGASARQAFGRATLPALLPAAGAAVALAFLVGWSDYIVTVVVGGGQYVTAPVLVASAASGPGNEPTVAAYALLTILPLLAAIAAVAGLTSTRRGRVRREGEPA